MSTPLRTFYEIKNEFHKKLVELEHSGIGTNLFDNIKIKSTKSPYLTVNLSQQQITSHTNQLSLSKSEIAPLTFEYLQNENTDIKQQILKLQKQLSHLNQSNIYLKSNTQDSMILSKKEYEFLVNQLKDYEEINELLDTGNEDTKELLDTQVEQIDLYQRRINELERQLANTKFAPDKEQVLRDSIAKIQEFQQQIDKLEKCTHNLFREKEKLEDENQMLKSNSDVSSIKDEQRSLLLQQIERKELELQWAQQNANMDKVQQLQSELNQMKDHKHDEDDIKRLEAESRSKQRLVDSLKSRTDLQHKRIKGLEFQVQQLQKKLKEQQLDQQISSINNSEMNLEKELQEVEYQQLKLQGESQSLSDQQNLQQDKHNLAQQLQESQTIVTQLQELRESTKKQTDDEINELLQVLEVENPVEQDQKDIQNVRIKDLEKRYGLLEQEYESFKQLMLLRDKVSENQRQQLLQALYKNDK